MIETAFIKGFIKRANEVSAEKSHLNLEPFIAMPSKPGAPASVEAKEVKPKEEEFYDYNKVPEYIKGLV